MKLTSDSLIGVQDKGGSILGVQGPHATMEKVLDQLLASGANQVYLIGGAGTLRASLALKDLVRK